MAIKAVFFDMGGTIENFWRTSKIGLEATPGFHQLLLSAGIDLNLGNEELYKTVTSGLDRYYRWCAQSLYELPTQRVLKEFVFIDYPAEHPRLDPVSEELMCYLETRYFHQEMRPEMPVVLEAIRQMGFKIGLISNAISLGGVASNLEKYNIKNYFDPIVLSSEYGRCKPDPAIFHYGARLASAPTSACAFVGDRASRDIVGSKRAGYRLAVLIRNKIQKYEDDKNVSIMPDEVIDEMPELIDILRAQIKVSAKSQLEESTSLGMIRAILFDAGDILYFRPYPRRNLKRFLSEMVPKVDAPAQEEIDALQNQAFHGLINQDQFREAVLRLYGVSRSEDLQRGMQSLIEDENALEFFPGVRKTLYDLKEKGYLLGIITDSAVSVSVKLSWLERGGCGEVWDTIISSQEVGIRKPDPQIYRVALEQLGIPSHQAAFVGHEAIELDGARSVGMKTIAFNFENAAKADFYLKNFPDLLQVPIIIKGSR
ncbi:MAG: HAD family hydrolase [Anaerolineales bacterium]|jgi:putative hydrolase of the HAD superfamily